MQRNIALTGLARDLAVLEQEGRPIRIGLVGSGEMGTDLVVQISRMAGLRLCAITDRHPEKARDAIALAYSDPDRAVIVDHRKPLGDLVNQGKIGLVDRMDSMLAYEELDIVIDATGRPAASVEVGLKAMEAGKHVVMMNVEADVTVGALLKAEADRLGVTYTLGAGDEPSSCMELIEFATASGFRVIAAGKGKNNNFNVEATPDICREEALKRHMNPRLLVEFVDGSKTMVEMTALANATGLIPDCPGMHGPGASRDELARVLIPERDGGILSEAGRVDYTLGKDVAPGVFVVVETDHPRIAERFADLKVGAEGRYFTLIRPFHLTSLEVPLTCARIMLRGQADMVPLARPVAEACALAKKDLKPGDSLDAIGEYCYRGFILTAEDARRRRAVPLGLLQGGLVSQPISKGDLLTYEAVTLPEDSALVAFRARQDRLIATLR